MLLGESLGWVVYTAGLMNEFLSSYNAPRFSVFVTKTLYNVYPMFITSSSVANWIMYCTVS